MQEPGQGYNFKFQQVVEYLRGSQDCYGTRMHWVKLSSILTWFLADHEACSQKISLKLTLLSFLEPMEQGKSGFPMPGCFRGELEFPSTWCDFGCAVSKLDPTNKFDDMSNAWNWDVSLQTSD